MTTLKFDAFSMPAAELGNDNPNSDLKTTDSFQEKYRTTDKVTNEEKRYFGVGMIDSILPYTIQDNYDRCRIKRDFPAAILENDYIRAIFLPTLGGRLWSLFDKRVKRELLYVNPVFQPANLALRNAWFSGGVEWNMGIKGHHPFTCSPLFVEFSETEKHEPVLRMYEYERIRRTVFSIEAYIPENEGVLYIRNTIENTSDKESYTYWWSNMAVSQTPGVRVIVPAEDAFICRYSEGYNVLDKTNVPLQDGNDISYPENHAHAQDLFFNIKPKRKNWIMAVQKDGKGLAQFSQSILRGRKLFVWGENMGGKHWSEFLSVQGQRYIEIQAGLAQTQMEHLPINAGEKISWIEGYCSADLKPDRIHGEWNTAQKEAEKAISKYISLDDIDACLDRKFPKRFVKRQIVQYGSGWGYVENAARKHFNKPPISKIFDFPKESVTKKESIWLTILDCGTFDKCSPLDNPTGYQTNSDWLPLIDAAEKKEENWYACLQLGVALYACGQVEKSKKAFCKSNQIAENPWALRNLAIIAKNDDDITQAAGLMLEALATGCTECGILKDCGDVLCKAHMYKEWIDVFLKLPSKLRCNGRLKLYYATALLKSGHASEAEKVIHSEFEMSDIKEGEDSISGLWTEIHKTLTGEDKCHIPYKLDFRMHE